MLDHEQLDVYPVALDFLVFGNEGATTQIGDVEVQQRR